MRSIKISTKMLASILSVIIFSLAVLTGVSAISCQIIVEQQIQETMSANLNADAQRIYKDLDTIRQTAVTLAQTVAHTYQSAELSEYEDMLSSIVSGNDLIVGTGIWFEAYLFNEEKKFVAPYAYRDDNKVTVTYDYCDAFYDYFSQDFYVNALNAETAVITAPYFNETVLKMMSTCTIPMISNGKFIGCVTVDMGLTSIQNMIDSVTASENGYALLISEDGKYLAGVEEKKVKRKYSILSDENTSLAEAGAFITENTSGTTSFLSAEEIPYQIYFHTLEEVNWKLLLCIPESEITKPVLDLVKKLLTICIVTLFCSILVVLLQITFISKNIRKVQKFAGALSNGDFSIRPLNIRGRDELGQMGKSLNEMFKSNRSIIQNISAHAQDIQASSHRLNCTSELLSDEFIQIQESMTRINDAMMTASASTHEVNSNTEKVESAIAILAREANDSLKKSGEIKQRAADAYQNSHDSCISAQALSSQFETQLHSSMENAKIVENIEELASVIAGIAGEINLLSLNASIEAARAGEHGRGFSVVASEIGNLAKETSTAVTHIQDTIQDVQNAFHQLADHAAELLSFVQDKVTPDYTAFAETAKQYGDDAQSLTETARQISQMAESIREIMNDVTTAMSSIAETSHETAGISGGILQSVEDVSGSMEEVSQMANEQKEISNNLNMVVQKFKFE